MLAFTGDKKFLTSTGGDAFLMYQVRGSTWAVMGDPVGAPSAWPELFWRVRAMADAAQGRLLLYQISPASLPFAIELGLQILKYGEEAIVHLPSFSLEGPKARPLRHAARRAAREGALFEIAPAAEVPPLLGELRTVSDQWLESKGHGEKSFSLGRFDEAYLGRFDLALVRCGGRITAFANLWATANREELSVDLMRHREPAPYGTMDFLFTRLMAWGRDQGYARFSLGLAPLSGIEARPLSPAWAKIAALLFRHGERFYGFRGLRAYKEKFAPEWEPRYVAGPGGLSLMRAMADLRALIGG
jgi:phosphatidylglycerol lysyltransferase